MSNFELKDSGERRTFASGAVRDRGELKPRPDLVSPHAQMREGMIFARGAEKYAIRNWEKGMPISECLASAQRHTEQYKRGDTDEDHLAQARWNLGAIIHYEEEIKAGRMDPSLDDMPKYTDRPDWETDDGREGISNRETVEYGMVTPYPTRPTFYIAGPMRGFKDLNFPAFDAARDRGETLGYNIISPADLDRAHGIDPEKDPTVVEHEDTLSPAELREIVRRDIDVISSLQIERGDGIAVLPGWQNSTGAIAEVRVAQWLGLRIVDTIDWLGIKVDK